MTLNHAWMLKGWLLSEHAPQPIMEAVEAVIESLTPVNASVPLVDLPMSQIAASNQASVYIPTPQPVMTRSLETPADIAEVKATPAAKSPGKQPKIPDGDLAKIKARFEAGLTFLAIAEPYGCSDQTVRNFLMKHGIDVRKKPQEMNTREKAITKLPPGVAYGVDSRPTAKAKTESF